MVTNRILRIIQVNHYTGAILFAIFIGYATSIVQSHNASKRLYAEKYSSVKHYMIFRKLPTDLRRRISDYYENRFQGINDDNLVYTHLT